MIPRSVHVGGVSLFWTTNRAFQGWFRRGWYYRGYGHVSAVFPRLFVRVSWR